MHKLVVDLAHLSRRLDETHLECYIRQCTVASFGFSKSHPDVRPEHDKMDKVEEVRKGEETLDPVAPAPDGATPILALRPVGDDGAVQPGPHVADADGDGQVDPQRASFVLSLQRATGTYVPRGSVRVR